MSDITGLIEMLKKMGKELDSEDINFEMGMSVEEIIQQSNASGTEKMRAKRRLKKIQRGLDELGEQLEETDVDYDDVGGSDTLVDTRPMEGGVELVVDKTDATLEWEAGYTEVIVNPEDESIVQPLSFEVGDVTEKDTRSITTFHIEKQ